MLATSQELEPAIKVRSIMEIEEQILNQPTPISVDREDVRNWLEDERTKMNRGSLLRWAGVALVFVCLTALVYQLLDAESRKVKELVGTYPSSNEVMLAEITDELCGQEPAEYWIWQASLSGSRNSLASF